MKNHVTHLIHMILPGAFMPGDATSTTSKPFGINCSPAVSKVANLFSTSISLGGTMS